MKGDNTMTAETLFGMKQVPTDASSSSKSKLYTRHWPSGRG